MNLHLTKHHGLGNDFVVVAGPFDPDVDESVAARTICDRRRGVGADGLLHVTEGGPDGADLTMVLHNADGGRAEMSGNGVRCLVQGAIASGLIAEPAPGHALTIATDAGARRVTIVESGHHRMLCTVEMGEMRGADPSEWGLKEADAVGGALSVDTMAVDAGNPHLVHRFADRAAMEDAADRTAAGRTAVNVEHVAAAADHGRIWMRVVERGVGETLACGTGACASAWAARRWGMGGDEIVVQMPGGDAIVSFEGDRAFLTGPTVLVARLQVDLEVLLG